MLRKVYLFVIALLIIAGCKNNTIEINGKLTNYLKGDIILLDELKANELVTIDSAMVSDDGVFALKLNVKSPSFYLLKTDNTNFLTMVLEPGEKIEFQSHRDSLAYPKIISGSKGTELLVEYNRILQKTITRLSKLSDIYIDNIEKPELPEVIERLDSLAQTYLSDINSYTKKFIDQNLNSLVSLVALYQQVAPGEYVLNPETDIKYFMKVDSALMISYPGYEPVLSLHEQVGQLVAGVNAQKVNASGNSGAVAAEISLPNPAGEIIKLSSTRGSVVLLDFWAAWCSPCRRENPNLVKAYDKYHRKGFEIFQVSLDKTREAWLKGIEDDKLGRWIHVSDLKYWNSVVVPLYRIESIPASFLLDREGKIIATNLRGEALEKKLAEILD
jgi:peroxiredoxin